MNDPGICFDKIYKSYLNTPVFSGLSVRFPSGRLIGLLGENGVGKTTLLKMAAGILKPDKGEDPDSWSVSETIVYSKSFLAAVSKGFLSILSGKGCIPVLSGFLSGF